MDNLEQSIPTEAVTPDAGGLSVNPVEGSGNENAAASGVPEINAAQTQPVAPVGAEGNQNQQLTEGKQPEAIDPLAVVKQHLGEIQIKGKAAEIRDLDHLRRLVQSGYGAAEASAAAAKARESYEKVSQPYTWLNEKLADAKNQRLFQYFRHHDGLLEKVAGFVEEWEKTGQLDPRVLEMGAQKMQLSEMQQRLQQYTEAEKQQAAQQSEMAERAELVPLQNQINNGLPFTTEQIGSLRLMKLGAEAAGMKGVTLSSLARELAQANLWVVPKPNVPQAAPGVPGKPQAQRTAPPPREENDDVFLDKWRSAFRS